MNKYRELVFDPPKIEVKENAREVIFKTVSCMCDNVHYLTFRKNEIGDWSLPFKLGNGIRAFRIGMACR